LTVNLFSAIEGLHGENLGSALLRFILLRSQDSRVIFAEILTDLYAESCSVTHRFACTLEGSTNDDALGSGRVDLIIEMDDVLVGIESKFNAQFQEGQPEKYLPYLTKRADELSKAGLITKNRRLLVILAPSDRESEVKKKISIIPEDQKTLCKFLAWEYLLSKLMTVAHTQDNKTREILTEFSDYVNSYLTQSFFHKDQRWFKSLSTWVKDGSERQRKVVAELWDFFPSPGGGLSRGDGWLGYYFGNKGWYGFVDRQLAIKQSENSRGSREAPDAVFVIVVGYDLSSEPDPDIFQRTSMKGLKFCGHNERSAWIVDIEKLDAREKWAHALLPFLTK
jgi:PD-(D/E)XK nuclease superfamily